MGIKINNRTKLPPLESPEGADYLPITDYTDGSTKTVSISGLNASLSGVKQLSGSISSSTTFTSSSLIGATNIYSVHLNGVEVRSSGQYDSFDNTSGTITFTTALSGNLNIVYA